MKEKKSFKERVMSFLKLDDAGKVEAFQKQAVKTWKEQIEIRQKEVEKGQVRTRNHTTTMGFCE